MTRALETTARQVVFPRKGSVDLDEVAVEAPTGGDMLLRVKRVGICATDLHLLEGHIGDPFPLVPGHEFVGEIAALGPEAERDRGLAVGDRVSVEMLLPCNRCARCREGRYNLCDRDDPASGEPVGREYGINIPRTHTPGLWGGYADILTVPANAIVHPLPASIPWDTAALVEPLAVAFRAVARGRVSPGEDVVVIGPGPVGLLIAAAAKTAGAARVVMVGTRQSRLDLALRFGADATVNSREADAPDAVRGALGGRLADAVIEIAGVPAAQRQAVTLVRRGGRVVLAGACGANALVEFQADEQLLTREIDILPSFLSAGGYEPSIAALERNAFPYAELVTHRFPLEDVEAAYEVVRGKQDGVIKAILVPND
ncbi:zinc-dependent alcohol dehydrogenase [Microbacterium terricola]|uniref:Erythritol/L-threitol dehydrogenase n=1 Tax=Microbacterium terricola TaxID=344163 RepID=A0ABM8E3C4_9MICO|nr:alcohol dehydrogenase catalytic domain-containing protein [Microbacterium terricola]UYK40044.1 alcohol dehydrogenase catalytic domain-containing protein [Microbacterium terricola]BDV32262.1 erythritol/L-threitol dehydrogenase [Microbacterium terricola]